MEIALQADMEEYNTTMNIGKTAHDEFKPGEKPAMTVLKSHIDREKELKNRKAKAAAVSIQCNATHLAESVVHFN